MEKEKEALEGNTEELVTAHVVPSSKEPRALIQYTPSTPPNNNDDDDNDDEEGPWESPPDPFPREKRQALRPSEQDKDYNPIEEV